MRITAEEEQKFHEKVAQINAGERAMRDPGDVLDRLLEIVPEDQTALRLSLGRVRRWCAFAAPEILHNAWHKMEAVLSEDLGQPTPEWTPDAWQWRVGRIMRAEEE